ncbi:hypothetical protein M8494_09255 [Serratia ureilytica]
MMTAIHATRARTLQAAIDAAPGRGDGVCWSPLLFQVPVKLAAHRHSAGLPQPQRRRRRPVARGSLDRGRLDNGGKTGSFNAMG